MDKIDISKLKIPEVDMSEYKDVVTIVTDMTNQVDKEILKNDRISYQDGWRAGYAAALEAERQRRKSYRPKLLPCKYCGGKRRYVSMYCGKVKGIGLVCCKCGHRGGVGKSENEAHRLWNEEMEAVE